MRFHYVASDHAGNIVNGNMDATNPVEVLNYLGSQKLQPVSIKAAGQDMRARFQRTFFGGNITTVDKIFLTKYLALMLKVGTDLFKALDILIADFDKPAVKNLLIEIRSALERGQPFYTTFANYPRVFSPVFVNLIKAGESSGNLDQTFAELSVTLERDKELRGRIKGALTYPIILLVLSFVILLFLVSFAIPKIANVFSGFTKEPPLFSKIVFTVGLFVGNNIIPILIIIFGGGAFLGYFFFGNTLGRHLFQKGLNKTPIVKTLIKKIAIERFASTFASLMKAGLPIIESLEITADAVGNEEMKLALQRIARQWITKGLTIGDAFKKEPVFPVVVANLVNISEKAGHLEDILRSIAQFYNAEVDASLKTVVAFIEPILLLFIGAVIGTIALAVIVPIYQLVGQF